MCKILISVYFLYGYLYITQIIDIFLLNITRSIYFSGKIYIEEEMFKMTSKQISEFKTYLINEEKSKATIEKYIGDVFAFSSWLAERELEKSVVLEYKERIIKMFGISINMILSIKAIMQSFLRMRH